MHAFEELRSLSVRDFAELGVEYVAYIKPVMIDDAHQFAIHSADGSVLSVIEDRDTAEATILENDLFPVSVH